MEDINKKPKYIAEVLTEALPYIKKFRGKIPLFHDVGIEKKLNQIFEPTIKLESGGYLVINPTEALVSIDINSGQSIKEISLAVLLDIYPKMI